MNCKICGGKTKLFKSLCDDCGNTVEAETRYQEKRHNQNGN